MKMLMLLANGFETVEALAVVDILVRHEIEIILASTTQNKIVESAHKVSLVCDCFINEINVDDFNMLLIPGGAKGAQSLCENEAVIKLVQEFDLKQKYIGAICAGPTVLLKADIIRDRKITSHPSVQPQFKEENYLTENVVVSENIITARNAGLSFVFAQSIINMVCKNSKNIIQQMNEGTK